MTVESSIRTFVLPTMADVETAIMEGTIQRLRVWLQGARPGFCARLDDLPAALMARVAEGLFTECAPTTAGAEARANVRLLVDRPPARPWECEWTEAVRLRNPDERGEKRPPLLLLIPPGTALLGSLDADTFKVVSCDTVVQELVAAQLRALPDELAPLVGLIRQYATTDVQRLHYLLTSAANGYTAEAAGLALCILGLWPHGEWLASGEQREYWLTRNKQIVSHLKGGTTSLFSRVYDLGLKSSEQTARLYELVSTSPTLEEAAGRVATDPAWRDLDFGLWDFASRPETVVVTLDPLGLPQREDGYQVLKLQEQPYLALSWSSDPAPAHVPDLTHYLVELLPAAAADGVGEEAGQEAAEVAYRSEAIAPGKSARKSFRIRDLRALMEGRAPSESGVLPEGLYRVRVTAWAKATNITAQRPSTGGTEVASNLSDYFWLEWNREEEDTEPPPRRLERTVANFLEARREVQWDLITRRRDPASLPTGDCVWDSAVDGRAAQATCTVQFGRQTFRIRLSNVLRRIEAQILVKPEELGALSANLTYSGSAKDLALTARSDLPRLSPNDPFLAARSALFAKLRGADGRGLVETADLLALRDEIVAYAREYAKLLHDAEQEVAAEPKQWPDRVGLATMDTIRMRLPGLSEQTSVAMLLAPTHPLRLLWSLQLALLGEAWLSDAWRRGSADSLSADAWRALQGGLHPANIPPVLFDRRRVGYLYAGRVAPSWGVYLPANIADKQSALARLSRAVASTAMPLGDGARMGEVADRVLRYLRQHPYVGELQINVFNPGDGKIVVDLLNNVDKQYPDLRYEVRLFSHEGIREDLGAALDQLVNPEITATVGETADKYSQGPVPAPSESELFEASGRGLPGGPEPLRGAHLRATRRIPSRHRHRLLADHLAERGPVRACPGRSGPDLRRPRARYGNARSSSDRRRQGTRWRRGCRMRRSERPASSSRRWVPVPRTARGVCPPCGLTLTIDGQNLLYEIHRVSDWVLTLDRHLGIDYFDSAVDTEAPGSPAILLDFAPEFLTSDHAVLMLTTQVGSEIDKTQQPPHSSG
ncbi:MAG: hypothetical protein U0556_16650 [Dehalococcoidia bacterium]